MDTIKILVADDHLVVREGLCGMLNDEDDLEVIGQADNGAAAVDSARELNPDVVVMDLQMPELNGGQAMQQIRAENPDAKFVVLTTYDSDHYILMGIEGGANAFLLKDTPRQTLFDAIRTVHRGQQYLQPKVASKVLARFVELARKSQDSETLSDRELEVLRLIADGLSNKRIGVQLSITERTVKKHVTNILQKLGVGSRSEALAQALHRGLIKT